MQIKVDSHNLVVVVVVDDDDDDVDVDDNVVVVVVEFWLFFCYCLSLLLHTGPHPQYLRAELFRSEAFRRQFLSCAEPLRAGALASWCSCRRISTTAGL